VLHTDITKTFLSVHFSLPHLHPSDDYWGENSRQSLKVVKLSAASKSKPKNIKKEIAFCINLTFWCQLKMLFFNSFYVIL